jgi:hypothetical protein
MRSLKSLSIKDQTGRQVGTLDNEPREQKAIASPN